MSKLEPEDDQVKIAVAPLMVDIIYMSQRLERYETTLQKITHTTTHMQAKFFAQESLKEGNS